MTTNELRHLFNERFSKEGIEKPPPERWEVDADTYANVCQEFFNWAAEHNPVILNKSKGIKLIETTIGRSNGIYFKGVELILVKEPKNA